MENKKIETINVEETNEVTVVEEKENKLKKAFVSVGQKVKQHKKAIITVGLVAAGAIALKVLRGKKSDDDFSISMDNDDDLVTIDETSDGSSENVK